MTPGGDLDEGAVVGHVAELWRYPVKSLGGERLTRARCERRGLEGDRRWAVVGEDGKIGSGKTTQRFRRMPGLLHLTGSTDADGTVWVHFPDGRRAAANDPATAARLSQVVGEPVRLLEESETSHLDDGPLHLVTTGALDDLGSLGLEADAGDRRRFRPNVVVAAARELAPSGRLLVGATTELAPEASTVRCVMTTMGQPGLPFQPAILRQLERHRAGCFGVYATVEREGEIAIGDPVSVLP